MNAIGDVTGTGWTIAEADSPPPEWASLISEAPAADYSHSAHWHNAVCAQRTGARQVWLTARDGGQLLGAVGAIAGPAPGRRTGPLAVQRLDSSVEGTSGGPLVRTNLADEVSERVFGLLVDELHLRRRRPFGTVAMALNPTSESRFGHLLRGRPDWRRQSSPTAMVSLAGGAEAVARDRLVMNKRNERNRGLRRGAEVFATRDASLLAAYYPLYARAAAHWGVVATPLGLLRQLLADPSDRVFMTCVRHEGQVIGGHLCLHLGERVFAWNGVTDPAFARSHFPATLCFWGDIVEACRRRAAWLDFGASGGVNSLSGFKKYFGAELMERGFYVSDTPGLRALRRVRAVLRRSRGVKGARWHDGRTGKPAEDGNA